MKPRDISKLKALHQAVIDVIIKDGYQNLTITNIVKRACISLDTVYSYYPSKNELVGTVFTETKNKIDSIFFKNLDVNGPVEQEFKRLVRNYAMATNQFPREAAAMRILFRHPKLVPRKYFYSLTEVGEMINLIYSRGVSDHYLRSVDVEILTAFMLQPVDYIADIRFRYNERISNETIEQLVEMSWKSCRV
jgi:AcrR family transcriptional regulator